MKLGSAGAGAGGKGGGEGGGAGAGWGLGGRCGGLGTRGRDGGRDGGAFTTSPAGVGWMLSCMPVLDGHLHFRLPVSVFSRGLVLRPSTR